MNPAVLVLLLLVLVLLHPLVEEVLESSLPEVAPVVVILASVLLQSDQRLPMMTLLMPSLDTREKAYRPQHTPEVVLEM